MKTAILHILFILTFSLFHVIISGQTGREYNFLNRLEESKPNQGEINITLDPRIEDNFHKHILYNYKNQGIPGFRVRIFSDSGFDAKERALESRTHFLTKYENIEAYIQYDIPNYKVYAGDCRTRSEALKILELIKKDFPNAFIVVQNINIVK